MPGLNNFIKLPVLGFWCRYKNGLEIGVGGYKHNARGCFFELFYGGLLVMVYH